MSQRIELRALLNRDGRILLFRGPGTASWELPGGAFDEEADDIDAAMDSLLRACNIATEDIAEAFLQTAYIPDRGSHYVLNLYAPADWIGEPRHPEGHEHGWHALHELTALGMDAGMCNAVLAAYGVIPDASADEALSAIDEALGLRTGAPLPRRDAGLDVLRTLGGGGDPAIGLARLQKNSPELATDIVDFALGEVWSHPALDRKTRSLEVVAMLAALGGRPGPLRSHLNGALNHGATPEEVVQTLRMVAVYAGFPAALEAWPIMEEVFAARAIPRPGRDA